MAGADGVTLGVPDIHLFIRDGVILIRQVVGIERPARHYCCACGKWCTGNHWDWNPASSSGYHQGRLRNRWNSLPLVEKFTWAMWMLDHDWLQWRRRCASRRRGGCSGGSWHAQDPKVTWYFMGAFFTPIGGPLVAY